MAETTLARLKIRAARPDEGARLKEIAIIPIMRLDLGD
jgi:hypothetical protein